MYIFVNIFFCIIVHCIRVHKFFFVRIFDTRDNQGFRLGYFWGKYTKVFRVSCTAVYTLSVLQKLGDMTPEMTVSPHCKYAHFIL